MIKKLKLSLLTTICLFYIPLYSQDLQIDNHNNMSIEMEELTVSMNDLNSNLHLLSITIMNLVPQKNIK